MIITAIFYILVALLLRPAVSVTECPNPEFRIVASYGDTFSLSRSNEDPHRYWVAFGIGEKWSLSLVDAVTPITASAEIPSKRQWAETKAQRVPLPLQVFVCEESIFPLVAKPGKKEKNKHICCVAPFSIDEKDKEKQTTKPFAVVIDEMHSDLKSAPPLNAEQLQVAQLNEKKLKPEQLKYLWRIHKPAAKPYLPFKWDILLGTYPGTTTVGFQTEPPIDLHDCFGLGSEKGSLCATGITADIIVIRIDWSPTVSMYRFAFSGDGIINKQQLITDKYAQEIEGSVGKKSKYKNGAHFSYFAMPSYFKKKVQDPPTYNGLALQWRLGSFCASCPSTSMRISISQSEAQMNKERIQHSLSVAGRFGASGASLSAPNVAYARVWFHEASETLTSGRATTISAVCNGIYLWYYSIHIGGWGTGDTVMPTQLFYCTDKPRPPQCRPRIRAKEMDYKKYGKICDGHDVDSDFDTKDLTPAQKKKEVPWMTMHQGRPKPIRIQGQKQDKKEPPLVIYEKFSGVVPRSTRKKASTASSADQARGLARLNPYNHYNAPYRMRTMKRGLVMANVHTAEDDDDNDDAN